MKALKSYTIPELIEALHHKGVFWVGKTTRKAPLIDLLVNLESQQELNNSMVRHICKSLDHLTQPLPVLVALCRYWGSVVTSDDLADVNALQERVKRLAKEHIKPLTVAKVLNTSMNQLSQKGNVELREHCKVLKLEAEATGNDKADKCNMLYYLKHHIAAHNRDFTRNLTVDLENCHRAYDTAGECLRTLPDNLAEYPREYIRPNGIFLPHVVKNLMTRGFYEPDIRFSATPHSFYFCCDLDTLKAQRN